MTESYVGSGALAKALGISRNTVANWRRAKRITPAYETPGHHFMWDIDNVRRELRVRESK